GGVRVVRDGGAGGAALTPARSGSAAEIEQRRRVVAQRRGARPGAAPPVIADVAETRHELLIEERLIDPKAIPLVRRVPRVSARRAAQEPERVEPSEPPQGLEPGRCLRSERRGLLVDARPAG